MKIAIVGTGHIGTACGACFAEFGHNVFCTDINQNKIEQLQKGIIPMFENGLQALVDKNLNDKLKFTTDLQAAITEADFIIITVAEPLNSIKKNKDLKQVYSVIKKAVPYIKQGAVIAIKTTVPVGTGSALEKFILTIKPDLNFDIISLPEFLREGFAVYDFFNPDRIIVGCNKNLKDIKTKLFKLYSKINRNKFIFMNTESAETVKYAANSFLAAKIQFINEMSLFCKTTGADINDVAYGIGTDHRIGCDFFNAGPGFGGFCLPKDTEAVVKSAADKGIKLSLIKAVVKGNKKHKKFIAGKILNIVKNIKKPKIAILGLAFKAGTDDCRQSPSIDIIKMLLKYNVSVSIFDPHALNNAKKLLNDNVIYAKNEYDCCKNADIAVILTEWSQFKKLNYSNIAKLMKNKNIFDTRNILDGNKLIKTGFNLF